MRFSAPRAGKIKSVIKLLAASFLSSYFNLKNEKKKALILSQGSWKMTVLLGIILA